MSAAYAVPAITQQAYQQHGEAVVNMARHIAANLYCARSRLEMTREALDQDELSKAAEHAKRRSEHVAEIRASIKRYGPLGEQALRLAKQMEGQRA